MSVSASTSRVQYDCNGSTVAFPFLFGIQETSDIQVILTDSNGTETTLTETTHYVVSAVNSDYESGGTVTTVATYADGYTITLVRNVPITQESDFTEGMPTLYETFEDGLDKLTMIAQQIEEKIDRQLVVPVSEPSTISRELPSATARAGKFLGFDDEGEPVAVTEIEGVSLTTFGNSLLLADDAAEARTALETYSETETDAAITAAVSGLDGKWNDVTAFNDQPASTSTITMTADLTASIKPGMAIKFKLSGTYYYAVCTSIAAGLLTIAGAPLTTGDGDLEELYYSNLHGQVIQIPILVPGYFADATETTLLLNDNLEYLKWCQSKAYLVMMSATQKVADTGAENTVNCSIAGSNVFSTALTLSATAGTWVDTVVAVTTANYDINFGEAIELVATKVGNGDCTDLSVILTFVGE